MHALQFIQAVQQAGAATGIETISLEGELIKLIALSPTIAVLVIYILRLEWRHSQLYERYTVLQVRYIRDIRAVGKLPADEFADDLNVGAPP